MDRSLVGGLMTGSAGNWRTIAACLLVCAGCTDGGTSSAVEPEVVRQALLGEALGPVYPAPGGNLRDVSSSTPGQIGKAGGVSWTFSGFDTTAYTQLAWGPRDAQAIQYSWHGSTGLQPGETLTFNTLESDLGAGVARWTGSTTAPRADGGSFAAAIRFTITVTDAGHAALPLLASAALPQATFDATTPAAGGDLGAVLGVPASGFIAHLLFEANIGAGWVAATDLYDTLATPIGAPGTFSSFAGGFFYTSQPPVLQVLPAALAFGSVALGTSGSATVTIANSGPPGSSLQVANLLGVQAITGTNAFDFSVIQGCPVPLASGAFCAVTVQLTPTATGSRNALLTINSNDAASPHFVTLTGHGTAPAIVVSPTSVDFGGQLVGTSSPVRPLLISNPGTAPLSIAGITWSPGPADFEIAPGTCTGPVAPGQSCTAELSFHPTTSGAQSATLSFVSNAPGSVAAVALTGTGVIPGVALAPAAVGFGDVGVGGSASQVVTLSSTGGAPLDVAGVAVAGDFAVTGGTCPAAPFPLPPGTSCSIAVTFTPTAAGPRSGTLSVGSSAGPASVPLSGNGTALADLAIAIAGPGNAKVGANISYTITVSNVGPGSAGALVINDPLPSSTTFVSVSAAGLTCIGPPVGSIGTVSCSSGALAAGVTRTLTVVANVLSGGKTRITNTVAVSSATTDPNPANNTASVSTTLTGKK